MWLFQRCIDKGMYFFAIDDLFCQGQGLNLAFATCWTTQDQDPFLPFFTLFYKQWGTSEIFKKVTFLM